MQSGLVLHSDCTWQPKHRSRPWVSQCLSVNKITMIDNFTAVVTGSGAGFSNYSGAKLNMFFDLHHNLGETTESSHLSSKCIDLVIIFTRQTSGNMRSSKPGSGEISHHCENDGGGQGKLSDLHLHWFHPAFESNREGENPHVFNNQIIQRICLWTIKTCKECLQEYAKSSRK